MDKEVMAGLLSGAREFYLDMKKSENVKVTLLVHKNPDKNARALGESGRANIYYLPYDLPEKYHCAIVDKGNFADENGFHYNDYWGTLQKIKVVKYLKKNALLIPTEKVGKVYDMIEAKKNPEVIVSYILSL